MFVIGVDGCRDGWCAVKLRGDKPSDMELEAKHYQSVAEIVATQATVIAIDVPIGLLSGSGQRECDKLARQRLGKRHSSVFPPPVRQTLALSNGTHHDASELNRDKSGKGISKQTFHITKKVREVDKALSPTIQNRVFEVHPEVCFAALKAGEPMTFRKTRVSGRRERWSVLQPLLPMLNCEPELPASLRGLCKFDDYLDALVCGWTAYCIAEGTATRIPEVPQLDKRRLRMEMLIPAQVSPRD